MAFTSADVYRASARVKRPRAEGYNLSIGDLWLRSAQSREHPIRYGLRDSLAERTDEAGSSYENVLDIGYAWARTELDGGEALDWDPPGITRLEGEIVNDQRRFFDSKRLDSTTLGGRTDDEPPYAVRLTRQVQPYLPAITDATHINASINFIYVARGVTLERYADLNATTPESSWTFTNPIASIAANSDDTVTVVDDQGNCFLKPRDATGSSAFVEFYTSPTDGDPIRYVWYVKGRYISWRSSSSLVTSGELGEFDITIGGNPAAPTVSGTFVPFDSFQGVVWDVIDGGPAILAGISDGTVRSYVPQVVDTSGGAANIEMTVRSRTEMPAGEYPIALGFNAGVLDVLSASQESSGNITLRLYQGEVLDARFDYVAGNLRNRREWTEALEIFTVDKSVINTRDEMAWTVRERDGEAYLWIHDLGTFGISRAVFLGSFPILQIAVFDNRFIGMNDQGSLIRGGTLFEADGYMIFPNITFGLNTPINWIAYVVEAAGLDALGASITLYRSSDPDAIRDRNHPTWVPMRAYTSSAESGQERFLIGVTSRSIALKAEFTSADGFTSSPEMTRLAIRGIPSHRDYMVQIPINVSDLIEVPYRQSTRVPGWGRAIHEALLVQAGAFVELQILDPPVPFRGVIDNFGEPTPYITERGSASHYIEVLFRGSLNLGSQDAVGNAGLGIGLLGVDLLGVDL